MKTILLISIFFCINYTSAQFVLSHSNFNIYEYTNALSDIAHNSSTLNSEIEGSPYIIDAFLPIKFPAFGDDKLYSARFNAYDSSLEVIPSIGEKPIAITKNNKDLEFTFVTLNKTYRTYEYDDNGLKIDFFVNVLILDNISLLKKERIKLNDEVKANTPFNISKPKRFKRIDDEFFIKIKDNDIILMPTKKEIKNLFPKHGENVSSYLKNKKLKLDNEDDLKTLINFLNQLD